MQKYLQVTDHMNVVISAVHQMDYDSQGSECIGNFECQRQVVDSEKAFQVGMDLSSILVVIDNIIVVVVKVAVSSFQPRQ